MSDRPPSPPTPSVSLPTDTSEDRVVATTTQLSRRLEDALDCSLDDDVLEEFLLELERGEYVEWVTVTRDGDYVWDLTESPDRIGDAVATAVMRKVAGWLEGQTAE